MTLNTNSSEVLYYSDSSEYISTTTSKYTPFPSLTNIEKQQILGTTMCDSGYACSICQPAPAGESLRSERSSLGIERSSIRSEQQILQQEIDEINNTVNEPQEQEHVQNEVFSCCLML